MCWDLGPFLAVASLPTFNAAVASPTRLQQHVRGWTAQRAAYHTAAVRASWLLVFVSAAVIALQVVPPGFHLVPLPFRDDIRSPECDPALVGRVTAAGGRSGPPRANQQQVRRGCSGRCARCELGRDDRQGGAWDGSSRRAKRAATRRPVAGEAGLGGRSTPALCELGRVGACARWGVLGWGWGQEGGSAVGCHTQTNSRFCGVGWKANTCTV